MVVAFSTERKWLRENIEISRMSTKQRRLHHSSRVKLPEQVSELVFGVNIFDLDLGGQNHFVKQPATCNSVGSGHVSHHRTSSFDDHLDHTFVVLKNVKLGFDPRK